METTERKELAHLSNNLLAESCSAVPISAKTGFAMPTVPVKSNETIVDSMRVAQRQNVASPQQVSELLPTPEYLRQMADRARAEEQRIADAGGIWPNTLSPARNWFVVTELPKHRGPRRERADEDGFVKVAHKVARSGRYFKL